MAHQAWSYFGFLNYTWYVSLYLSIHLVDFDTVESYFRQCVLFLPARGFFSQHWHCVYTFMNLWNVDLPIVILISLKKFSQFLDKVLASEILISLWESWRDFKISAVKNLQNQQVLLLVHLDEILNLVFGHWDL